MTTDRENNTDISGSSLEDTVATTYDVSALLPPEDTPVNITIPESIYADGLPTHDDIVERVKKNNLPTDWCALGTRKILERFLPDYGVSVTRGHAFQYYDKLKGAGWVALPDISLDEVEDFAPHLSVISFNRIPELQNVPLNAEGEYPPGYGHYSALKRFGHVSAVSIDENGITHFADDKVDQSSIGNKETYGPLFRGVMVNPNIHTGLFDFDADGNPTLKENYKEILAESRGRTITPTPDVTTSTPINNATNTTPQTTEEQSAETTQTNTPEPAIENKTPIYVEAQRIGTELAISYTADDGSNLEMRDGSRAWRNNNPGNIKFSEKKDQNGQNFAERHGAIGKDRNVKGFAIFPDYETGRKALESLLKTESYQKETLEQALHRYAPKFENDTETYIRHVVEKTGIDRNTKLSEISETQLILLADAIEQHEGYIVGTVIDHGPQTTQLAQTQRQEQTQTAHTQPDYTVQTASHTTQAEPVHETQQPEVNEEYLLAKSEMVAEKLASGDIDGAKELAKELNEEWYQYNLTQPKDQQLLYVNTTLGSTVVDELIKPGGNQELAMAAAIEWNYSNPNSNLYYADATGGDPAQQESLTNTTVESMTEDFTAAAEGESFDVAAASESGPQNTPQPPPQQVASIPGQNLPAT